MAVPTWNRPAAETSIEKTPVIGVALTQSPIGDESVVLDFYVDDSDTDFTTDTILSRLSCKIVYSGSKPELHITPRYWNGNDAYTSATNPADGTATSTDPLIKIPICKDLDAFYTTAGFGRTNPT